MTPLLSFRQLSKSFGARPLFQNITLGISQGERLGLIGPNGSGKSTLLRLLAGVDRPDSGELTTRRGVHLVYMPQEDDLPEQGTVGDAMESALAGENLESYERTAQISIALTQAGFVDADLPVRTLSGGWKKRLALARALALRPDLLLLDEPTNHLDLQGVLWLEDLLKNAPFAWMLVSHDRYFLEQTANRIVELNRSYPEGFLRVEGAYSDFLVARDDFLAAQAHRQHALEGQVKRETEWLRRGPQARTTKADSRIQEAHRLIGELSDVKARNSQGRAIDVDFTASGRRTRELLVARSLEKNPGERTLFSGLDLILMPGEHLGLIGPNGSGKTTLLRLLTGEALPDSGEIRRAEGLRIVYFDQSRRSLDMETSLRRALSPNSDTVIYRESAMHISAWARRFLFRAEQLDMPVSALSGGEQARILIANLMLQPADLLILDEPTNDLDIPSLEVLEESLREFPGALVLVSHDRFLLDRVSTQLLALDGRGGAAFYADYAQWEAASRQSSPSREKAEKTPAGSAPTSIRRLNTAEQRELGRMEETIGTAEAEVVALQARLSDADVASDHIRLQEAWQAVQSAQERVARLYARWEELESRR